MALPVMISKLEDVDESVRELYIEDTEGEGYILDLDDSSYKSKLDEFRKNNRKLHNAQQAAKKEMEKYKGIDPEKWAEAQERLKELDKLEEQGLLKDGDVEKVVEKRTATMRSEYEQQVKSMKESLAALEDERNKLRGKLGNTLIETTFRQAVDKVGRLRPGAFTDVVGRARQNWTVDEEGQLTAKDLFNEKGDPMTPEEWSSRLLRDAPYLFEEGQGGGASGGKKGSGADDKVKRITANDPSTFGENLEAIASGRVIVSDE